MAISFVESLEKTLENRAYSEHHYGFGMASSKITQQAPPRPFPAGYARENGPRLSVLPNRRIWDILASMQMLYTPREVADLLGLDTDLVGEMAEVGRLSAFRLDNEWRISHDALLADLRRMLVARGTPKRLPLAPIGEELSPLDQSLPDQEIVPKDTGELQETFRVSIEIKNATSYAGDFQLRLLAEGNNDTWKNFDGMECNLRDAELIVHGRLAPGEVLSLFNGTLHAHVGDRLFVTVPEQDGIDVPAEKVYVLHADTGIKLLLTQSGFFSKRSVLQFQRL